MSAPLPPLALTPVGNTRLVAIIDDALSASFLPTYSQVTAELALERTRFPDMVRERAVGLLFADVRRLRLGHALAVHDLAALARHVAAGEADEALTLIGLLIRDAEAGAYPMPGGVLPDDVGDLERARARRAGSR